MFLKIEKVTNEYSFYDTTYTKSFSKMKNFDAKLFQIKKFCEKLDKEIQSKKESILNTSFYGEEALSKLLEIEQELNTIHENIQRILTDS